MQEKYFQYSTYLNYILRTVQLVLHIQMIYVSKKLKYIVLR